MNRKKGNLFRRDQRNGWRCRGLVRNIYLTAPAATRLSGKDGDIKGRRV